VTKSISGLSRENLGVRERHQLADVRPVVRRIVLLHSALLTAMKMLAERPFAATSPTRKNRWLVEAKEIVEIAAHLARRDHRARARPAVVAQELGARQRGDLHALRGIELSRHAGALLALALHDALERSALPRRLRPA
jgi:hypothetical protein